MATFRQALVQSVLLYGSESRTRAVQSCNAFIVDAAPPVRVTGQSIRENPDGRYSAFLRCVPRNPDTYVQIQTRSNALHPPLLKASTEVVLYRRNQSVLPVLCIIVTETLVFTETNNNKVSSSDRNKIQRMRSCSS
jgi:hypothetical protein